MPAVGQTPFYKSFLKIGSIYYPAYPGSVQLNCPIGYIVPPLIGNYWQVNYAPGLRQPMVSAQLAVRNRANEVLSSTFLNYWMARTTGVDNDTVAITNGIQIWNGRQGFKLVNGVKANSFTIGSSVGAELRFTAQFMGTDLTPFSGSENTAALTAFSGWSLENLISFNGVSFASPLDSAVWNWNLSFSNNHGPDLSHNGTVFVTAQNAGMQTAGFSLLTQAATLPAAITPNNGTFPPPVSPDTLGVTIAGSNITRVFTLNQPVNQNPDDMTIQAPRNMKEYQFLCLGGDSMTTPPLSIT